MGYLVGNVIRCRASFTEDDQPVDPATVTFKAKPPTGPVLTYLYGQDPELVRERLGLYRVDLTADVSGRWSYRFESSGTFQAANEAHFDVTASAI